MRKKIYKKNKKNLPKTFKKLKKNKLRHMRKRHSNYDFLCKACIIGNSGVGKTSMLKRYVDNSYDPNFISTIGVDFTFVTLEKDNKIVKLQLWDTAGQERFRGIVNTYYRGANAIVVCFDITDRQSFENIPQWINDLRRMTNSDDILLVLAATKMDQKDLHKVSKEEIQNLMERFNIKHFFETSSKTPDIDGGSIEKMFDIIVQNVIDFSQPVDNHPTHYKQNIVFNNEPKETKQNCCKLL